MKVCENCGNEHEGSYGSGRFCSKKCARGFSTKAKRNEINDKVSKKLNGSGHADVEKYALNVNSYSKYTGIIEIKLVVQ